MSTRSELPSNTGTEGAAAAQRAGALRDDLACVHHANSPDVSSNPRPLTRITRDVRNIQCSKARMCRFDSRQKLQKPTDSWNGRLLIFFWPLEVRSRRVSKGACFEPGLHRNRKTSRKFAALEGSSDGTKFAERLGGPMSIGTPCPDASSGA